MGVEVLSAVLADKRVIQQMMQLYQYDFSEFESADLDEDGCFMNYPYLDYYWIEGDRYPFLVRVNGKLAGFVLVNQHTSLPGSQYSVAEFFILRKYRKRGIGRQVAFHIFDLFCGYWEIHQIPTNIAAQKFWQSVVGAYTNGHYTETVMKNKDWTHTIQCFNNVEKLRS